MSDSVALYVVPCMTAQMPPPLPVTQASMWSSPVRAGSAATSRGAEETRPPSADTNRTARMTSFLSLPAPASFHRTVSSSRLSAPSASANRPSNEPADTMSLSDSGRPDCGAPFLPNTRRPTSRCSAPVSVRTLLQPRTNCPPAVVSCGFSSRLPSAVARMVTAASSGFSAAVSTSV